MPVLYNSNCLFEDKNGLKYSCDNLRIQGLLSDDGYCQSDFERYFNNPVNFRISDTCINTGIGKYKYLWTITCKNTTVTVLYCFNGYTPNGDDKRRVVLEFNPNKLEYDDFNEIHQVIRCLVDLEVVRCDLAIDIPIPRKFAHMVKDKRNYEYHDYNQNGVTEYLGSRNNTNRVKLYDKEKESELDIPMTRLEYTCKPSIMEFDKVKAKVIVERDQLEIETMSYDGFSKTQVATVKILQGLDVHARILALKHFSYRARKKISPYVLGDTYELEVDKKCVSAVFEWINKAIYNRSFTMT